MSNRTAAGTVAAPLLLLAILLCIGAPGWTVAVMALFVLLAAAAAALPHIHPRAPRHRR
ncbi:hypothetical protein P0W64_21125 [Tsukamurella sp. 8F]|uniref:hypothetical protein n=1 Tax=unclassified Tsukamurella TaxID=2633480 RepID=UPI0023B9F98D|nr:MULTISPECIES: hypothetical protein [unclassified Tsukamurella]MDF0532260.1 hypothetical protein [Tsukamurella sp. 8J]MDF0589286.1 hypothetical protein [Tsukamurella sp. 8F]